ncbi:MAG: hypothetical protein F6K56_01595 [Moorea sp. SIO3G5]|nr:hypothetical protein [Moorena sp. SIO3G5]
MSDIAYPFKAKGKRQKAKGKRQKAKGKRQKAIFKRVLRESASKNTLPHKCNQRYIIYNK